MSSCRTRCSRKANRNKQQGRKAGTLRTVGLTSAGARGTTKGFRRNVRVGCRHTETVNFLFAGSRIGCVPSGALSTRNHSLFSHPSPNIRSLAIEFSIVHFPHSGLVQIHRSLPARRRSARAIIGAGTIFDRTLYICRNLSGCVRCVPDDCGPDAVWTAPAGDRRHSGNHRARDMGVGARGRSPRGARTWLDGVLEWSQPRGRFSAANPDRKSGHCAPSRRPDSFTGS